MHVYHAEWKSSRIPYEMYCTTWDDHGSWRQCDNPLSVLRPVQIGPLHKAPSLCMCIYRWCVAAVSNSTCKSVGRAWDCIFIVHSLAVSFFWHRLLCPTPNSTEWLIACLLTWQGCDRFWCYRDQCGANGLTLSVIWPPVFITLHLYSPVFITVSGTLIPECNGQWWVIVKTNCNC